MSQPTPIKPAFPHPGGKTRLLKHILPAIPPHRVYVEPFCGAAAVLLAKEPARCEVINDLDGEMVTFYRYVRWHRNALLAELASWPGNARRDFADLLMNPGYTDLQRAARWYWLKVASFGAQGKTWGRDRNSYHGFDPVRHGKLIDRLARRLSHVMIESRDFEEVVAFYDGPDTFVFLDPPYVQCGKTAYHPFQPEDMARVRRCLDRLRGTWLLTCDDSPACREIFAGLPYREMSIRYSLNKNSGGKVSGELLILHPSLAAATDRLLPLPDLGNNRAA
ncbi:DNA adenine methylase [Ruficoccus amylovorans]|uniref:DNA adenine methylase n=1 Tax=Ruficoccus amylovorans TaxID=1804625 RepID=A0A842H9C3_9BACT|nr:DNA adenine methylase [Ruficoccus amylovorans]MBC2592708.1 DNA adenine methylase [Ruficoccus amylovorans]